MEKRAETFQECEFSVLQNYFLMDSFIGGWKLILDEPLMEIFSPEKGTPIVFLKSLSREKYICQIAIWFPTRGKYYYYYSILLFYTRINRATLQFIIKIQLTKSILLSISCLTFEKTIKNKKRSLHKHDDCHKRIYIDKRKCSFRGVTLSETLIISR